MQLVLISGPPRSGTTWLSRELSKGEYTSGFLPECTLLTQQVALYARTLNYCDPQRFSSYFGTQEALLNYYKDNLSRLLDLTKSLHASPENRPLVLKDPELTLYLNVIAEVMPKHDLVVLVRDPRDVVASVKKVHQRKNEAWDIRKSLDWIFTYYHAITLHLERRDDNMRFVRYEELVSDDHALDELRCSLKIPRTAPGEKTFVMDGIRANLDQSDPFFSDLYLKPSTKTTIGTFTTILNKEEIALVEQVFSGVMITWGYSALSTSQGRAP
jgi:hypothetical protein